MTSDWIQRRLYTVLDYWRIRDAHWAPNCLHEAKLFRVYPEKIHQPVNWNELLTGLMLNAFGYCFICSVIAPTILLMAWSVSIRSKNWRYVSVPLKKKTISGSCALRNVVPATDRHCLSSTGSLSDWLLLSVSRENSSSMYITFENLHWLIFISLTEICISDWDVLRHAVLATDEHRLPSTESLK